MGRRAAAGEKDLADLTILGICGSLRHASYNRLVLRAAAGLAPDGAAVATFDSLAEIPPYDDDVRAGSGFPPAVAALREAVRAAGTRAFAVHGRVPPSRAGRRGVEP